MARFRRGGSFRGVSRAAPPTQWSGAFDTGTLIGSGLESTTILAVGSAFNKTILRIRGSVSVVPSPSGNLTSQFGSFPWFAVLYVAEVGSTRINPVTVGVTAPGGLDDERILWHGNCLNAVSEYTIGTPTNQRNNIYMVGKTFEIDVRAMRKMEEAREIVFGRTTGSANESVDIFQFRFLMRDSAR